MHDHGFTAQDLRQIVAQSSPLRQRLGGQTEPAAADEGAQGQKRFEAWCESAARGDWQRFSQRLALDGLDLAQARAALGSPRPDKGPLPAWTGILDAVVQQAAAPPDDIGELRFLDHEHPIPFEDLLTPFVLVAGRSLAEQTGLAYQRLSPAAHTQLERSLLINLAYLSILTWKFEFDILRVQQQPPMARLFALAHKLDDQTLYTRFVEQMRGGGLVAFFKEYAVLARLMATITSLWVEAKGEFVRRLDADWAQIQAEFGNDSPLDAVSQVQPSLSDPHRGGRSVILLTFASGCKLVYKPKDMGMEAAYFDLLAWFNERDAPLPFKLLKVLPRGDYGWIEFAERHPCASEEEVQRYYRRAGMLLCLVYLLEGNDCHRENIIASGEHPLLIDLETLLHHRINPEFLAEGGEAEVLASARLENSVLRTGLLPTWALGKEGKVAYDLSGLGGAGGQETPYWTARWEGINTDRMTLEYQQLTIDQQANAPTLNGLPLRLQDHAGDLVLGFQQMYRRVMDLRAELLSPDSPLYAFQRQPVRFVARATQLYASLLDSLLQPRFLRDGVDRSIGLEALARGLIPPQTAALAEGQTPRLWPILSFEQQAMEQGDIPYLCGQADSAALALSDDCVIDPCFAEPSFNAVLARLRQMQDDDLSQQVALIQGALYTHAARPESPASAPVSVANPAVDELAPAPRTADELLEKARQLAAQLSHCAIYGSDGSAAWIGPHFLPQAQRYQLGAISYNLYDGASGIALFLAALYRVTGEADARALALAGLQPLRLALQRPESSQRTVKKLGIGGATGLGSVFYALTRCSQWLHEPALLDEARQASALLTPQHIAADQALDVLSGTAGTILGLAALHEVTGDVAALQTALACGQHLLEGRIASPAGPAAWPTLDGKLLTGFSHGAAGIAYALLRLYRLSGQTPFRDAAAQGIAYERNVFSPQRGNWPAYGGSESEPGAFMVTWCHGAGGIGLARLGGLAELDSAEIRQDIAVALQATLGCSLGNIDHLCCGNLGLSELLLVAGQYLARPDLVVAAQTRAAQVIARAEATGHYALNPLLPASVFSPSLFQGVSGIGYELLRLARPADLPSLLLWQ